MNERSWLLEGQWPPCGSRDCCGLAYTVDDCGVGWCANHSEERDEIVTNPLYFDYWWAAASIEPDAFRGLDHNVFPPGYAGPAKPPQGV